MFQQNDKIARDKAIDKTEGGPSQASIERRFRGKRRRDYESSRSFPGKKTVEELTKYYWEDARNEPGWNLDDLGSGA